MTKMPETMRVTMILERDQIVQGFITQQSILFNSVQQSTSPSLSTYSKASFLSWSFRSNFLMRHFHYHVEHSLHKIWGIWGTRPPATSQLDHVAPLTRWSIWEHNGRREGGIQGGWGCGGEGNVKVLETKQKAGTDLGTFWKGELGNLGLAGSLNGVGDGGAGVGRGLEWLYKLAGDFSFHLVQQWHSSDGCVQTPLLKSRINLNVQNL